jgi:hypothetical protein
MADNPPFAALDFDIRFMRKGKHSTLLFLPKEYHASIGLIVAYWGNFEVVFDSMLDGLLEGEKSGGVVRSTTDWRKQKFRCRNSIFKEVCSEWLSTWRPTEAQTLLQISDTAADLHWRRNMIAHGTYAFTMPPNSNVATRCRAISASTGKEMPFDEKVLKKLYHDISHLTADLVMTVRAFGEIQGPFHALPDTEILRFYRETDHPWHPNPAKRKPPLESSQA